MIRDICPGIRRDAAVAHGPRFDIHRVMDAGFAVFRAFAAAMPELGAELMVRRDGETRWKPFSEEEILLLKMDLLVEACRYDVSETNYRLRVGGLDISFEPFGGAALVRRGGEWLTADREPAERFDHAPKMTVASALRADDLSEDDFDVFVGRALGRPSPRDDGRPVGTILLDEASLRIVRTVLEPFVRKEGLAVDLGPLAHIRFPHERFGDGEGTLRIEAYEEA